MFPSFYQEVTNVLADRLQLSNAALMKLAMTFNMHSIADAGSEAAHEVRNHLRSLPKIPAAPAAIAKRQAADRGAEAVRKGREIARTFPSPGRILADTGKVTLAQVLLKLSADLTPGARADLPKKDFAVSASKSNTGERAYPIPDEQHARSALGFSAMHGDTADYERVRAKVQQKYPGLLKSGFAQGVSKEAEGLVRRLLHDPEGHKREIAGLATLMAAPADSLQAHARAAIAGDHNKAGVKKRELLSHVATPALEAAGLGVLMHHPMQAMRGH